MNLAKDQNTKEETIINDQIFTDLDMVKLSFQELNNEKF